MERDSDNYGWMMDELTVSTTTDSDSNNGDGQWKMIEVDSND